MTQTAPQLNISITPLKNALLVSEKQDLQVLVRLQAEQTNTTIGGGDAGAAWYA